MELLAAHCFNEIVDPSEEALDCGGADCLACNDAACGIILDESKAYQTSDVNPVDGVVQPDEWTYAPLEWCSPQNTDCRSGVCGADCRCKSRPIISAITFYEGAEGSWITISGSSFGNDRIGQAKVEFFTDPAENPGPANQPFYAQAIYLDAGQCGDTWHDNEIIVEVPILRHDLPAGEPLGDGPALSVGELGDFQPYQGYQ